MTPDQEEFGEFHTAQGPDQATYPPVLVFESGDGIEEDFSPAGFLNLDPRSSVLFLMRTLLVVVKGGTLDDDPTLRPL